MLTPRELEIIRRRASGESQRAVAKALKISQAAVSQFETKARRKILEQERQQALLKGFGVTIVDGIDGKRVTYGGGGR